MKAMALNTPFGFNAEQEHNDVDISRILLA